jgi:hypothetical protein
MESLKRFALKCAIALTFITSTADGWPWSNDDKHRIEEEVQRRVEAEQKLTEQEHKTDGLIIVAFILGIGCITFLIIGTALGSKGRQHAEEEQ